jgi:hypothetical protein
MRWVGSKLPHFMHAINNELLSCNHRDNASVPSFDHRVTQCRSTVMFSVGSSRTTSNSIVAKGPRRHRS